MKMAFAKLAGSLLLLSAALMAQSSGRMSGIVMDQSGAAVPNAKIGLFIPGGSAPVATTTSGVQGNYSLSGLQPVLYDVQVEMAGFRKVVVRQVKVDPGLEPSMPPSSWK